MYITHLFIIALAMSALLRFYLINRQINSIKQGYNAVPSEFAATISIKDHHKAGQYNISKLKLNIFTISLDSLLALYFTLGGGIDSINTQITHSYPAMNNLSRGVSVIIIYFLINAILHLPCSIYSTFGIEKQYGFNKTTPQLFISDLIKSVILGMLIAIPILYLVLWIMGSAALNMTNTSHVNHFWWIWVFAVVVGFNLLMMVIYPTLIAPLFNKFTPLADEQLRQAIDGLLTRCGFKTNGVFVMNGSKRSSHGNAYFTGFGKAKRIVFFDTLLKDLEQKEVLAILCHELGHFKCKHIIKKLLFSFTTTLIALLVMNMLMQQASFFSALGIASATYYTSYNALLLFSIILNIISEPLAPITSYLSRKHEFEADNFAKANSDKRDLISALIKLYRDNASTLTPDSLYVKFYYSHPSASERIANLYK